MEESKTELILPRKDEKGYYISYSQYTKWKESKRKYIRRYFFGEKEDAGAYAEFGTKVGEALEHNDFSGFSKEDQKFLKTIPRLTEFEREVDLYFDEGFRLMGYIDSNDISSMLVVGPDSPSSVNISHNVIDYKTGDIEDKKEFYASKDYKQLKLYGEALKQETGMYPGKLEVVLIGRKGNAFKGQPLELTREFVTIPQVIDPDEIEEIKKDVVKVAKEISECYKLFLRLV